MYSKLSRKPSRRKVLINQMIRNLLERGHVTTTLTRGKVLRRCFDRAYTLVRKSRSNCLKVSLIARHWQRLHKLTQESSKQSGLLSFTRMGTRSRDAVPIVRLSLSD